MFANGCVDKNNRIAAFRIFWFSGTTASRTDTQCCRMALRAFITLVHGIRHSPDTRTAAGATATSWSTQARVHHDREKRYVNELQNHGQVSRAKSLSTHFAYSNT